jgi:hypothetical protein
MISIVFNVLKKTNFLFRNPVVTMHMHDHLALTEI